MENNVPAGSDRAIPDGAAKTFSSFSFEPTGNAWSLEVAETTQQERVAQLAALLCSALGLNSLGEEAFFPATVLGLEDNLCPL